MAEQSVEIQTTALDTDNLGFFRWGKLGDRHIVTNDAGDWAILSADELSQLLSGEVGTGHPRFEEFQGKGFLRDGLDLDAFATKMAQRNRHVRRGPHVHVVTLSQNDGAANMSTETAEQIVDFALAGMSPAMSFEFQGAGGEPLENFATLQRFVEAAQTQNKQTTGKKLVFSVQTNLTAMTEEIAEWLIANEVLVCTRLDGPAAVHDANQKHFGGSTHADTVRWIEYFNRRYVELQRDPKQWHVEGRVAVTRATIGAAREVVDEYVQRGMQRIHLQPIEASDYDAETWQSIGYTADEYADFYRDTLDYIVDLNRKGVDLAEGMATIFLIKILSEEDPGIVDIQSPYGAGTSQLAYGVDGTIFPCDEARSGEETFAIGRVGEIAIGAIVEQPTVRAVAAASLLDAQPMCADCWNKPYCGFSPIRNFIAQGDLFGQRSRCFECKEHIAIARSLFAMLGENKPETTEVLKRWTVVRPPHAIDTRARKQAF